MGSTWGWSILWEGPLESGPVGCICCTLDCQVSGGCWTGQTSSDTGLTGLMPVHVYLFLPPFFPLPFLPLLPLPPLFLHLSSSLYFPFPTSLFFSLTCSSFLSFPLFSSLSHSPPGLLCHWHSQATIYLRRHVWYLKTVQSGTFGCH